MEQQINDFIESRRQHSSHPTWDDLKDLVEIMAGEVEPDGENQEEPESEQ